MAPDLHHRRGAARDAAACLRAPPPPFVRSDALPCCVVTCQTGCAAARHVRRELHAGAWEHTERKPSKGRHIRARGSGRSTKQTGKQFRPFWKHGHMKQGQRGRAALKKQLASSDLLRGPSAAARAEGLAGNSQGAVNNDARHGAALLLELAPVPRGSAPRPRRRHQRPGVAAPGPPRIPRPAEPAGKQARQGVELRGEGHGAGGGAEHARKATGAGEGNKKVEGCTEPHVAGGGRPGPRRPT